MRPNSFRTRVRFRVARLLGKVELTVWGVIAWLADLRDRRRDRKIAQALAADPQRYGRRPYEGITQTKAW